MFIAVAVLVPIVVLLGSFPLVASVHPDLGTFLLAAVGFLVISAAIGTYRCLSYKFALFPDRIVISDAFRGTRVVARDQIVRAKGVRMFGLRQVQITLRGQEWRESFAPLVLPDVADPETLAKELSPRPVVPEPWPWELGPNTSPATPPSTGASVEDDPSTAAAPKPPPGFFPAQQASVPQRPPAQSFGGQVWKVLGVVLLSLMILAGGAYALRGLLTPDATLEPSDAGGYTYLVENSGDRSFAFELYFDGTKVCAGILETGFFSARATCSPPRAYDGRDHAVKFMLLYAGDSFPRETSGMNVRAPSFDFEIKDFYVEGSASLL